MNQTQQKRHAALTLPQKQALHYPLPRRRHRHSAHQHNVHQPKAQPSLLRQRQQRMRPHLQISR